MEFILGILRMFVSGGPVLTAVWDVVKTHWKATLVLIVLVIVNVYIWMLHHEINSLTTAKELVTKNLQLCNTQFAQQTQVIDKAQQDSDRIIAEQKINAAVLLKQEQDRLSALIKKMKNKPLAATCDKAMDELRSEAQGSLKWEK